MSFPAVSELNAFVTVARTRNFRAAAKELNVSASALSHAISAMEARLDTRLLSRTTRSVSLTAAGEQFLGRVGPALREITGAIVELHEHRDTPRGLVRINASELAGEQFVSKVLPSLTSLLPDIELEVTADDRVIDIVAQGYDAGVRLSDMVPGDMISVPLGGDQRHVVVASPKFIRETGTIGHPADLRSRPCVRHRLPSGAITRWEFERHGELSILDPQGPLTFDSYRLGIAAALGAAGLAYVNEWAVADCLADGRLVSVLDEWCPSYRGLSLYYPSRQHMPAAFKALISMLRAQARTHDES